jgi:hypothetical protein
MDQDCRLCNQNGRSDKLVLIDSEYWRVLLEQDQKSYFGHTTIISKPHETSWSEIPLDQLRDLNRSLLRVYNFTNECLLTKRTEEVRSLEGHLVCQLIPEYESFTTPLSEALMTAFNHEVRPCAVELLSNEQIISFVRHQFKKYYSESTQSL